VSLVLPTQQLQVERLAIQVDNRTRIRKADLPRAVKEFGIHAPGSDQQVDSVSVAVPDLEQCRNRIVDVANPELRLVTSGGEWLSQGPGLLNP